VSILLDNVQSASYLTWSDKNEKYSRKTLPYVCNVKIGGANLVKADFVKLGKKSENYFSITIKEDFTILMVFNLHKTANKYLEQFGLTPQLVGNETDIVWNHFSKGKLSYIKDADQSVLLLHALRSKLARYYTGDVKSGMVKRIKDIGEEEILTAWYNIPENVEPLATIKRYASLRLIELNPEEEEDLPSIDNEAIVNEHQALAETIANETTVNPSARSEVSSDDSLPELTTFDADANKLPETTDPLVNNPLLDKFFNTPKAMVKRELIKLATDLGLQASKQDSNETIINLIDAQLTVSANA
jgi:hypothetical protein